jgi:hypothetical protein
MNNHPTDFIRSIANPALDYLKTTGRRAFERAMIATDGRSNKVTGKVFRALHTPIGVAKAASVSGVVDKSDPYRVPDKGGQWIWKRGDWHFVKSR